MNARPLAVAAACVTLPLLATAHDPQLRIPSFPDLKERANESVDIDLGWMPLHLLGWLAGGGDPDSAQVAQTIRGLKSVQIRSYQFSADYAYPQADVDRLRAQLSAPGWSQLVQVRNRGDDQGRRRENVDIYVALEDKKVKGLVIIACDPREFTIVNIVGPINLMKRHRLEGKFWIPKLGLPEGNPGGG